MKKSPEQSAEDSAPEQFRFVDGELHCERASIQSIAAAAGTPCYIYSAAAIRSAYEELSSALADVKHRIHYSVKANSNLGILALLRELGAGVDVVSGGELNRARAAGFDREDIVFGGVGKTDVELREAARSDLKLVNVESEGELERLALFVREAGTTCRVALRVNPEVTVDTPHPYTRTGGRAMKFGIPYDRALAAAARVVELDGLELAGLDFHIGSQISDPAPYRAALARIADLVQGFRDLGATSLRYLDAGGGLGVTYDRELPLTARQFAEIVVEAAASHDMELVVEPGRFLLGNAGILVTGVLDIKHSGGKDFVIVDAGMNDLIRPSHYNAYHRIEAVRERPMVKTADIVGPVCESGDFLGLDREVPALNPGDLLAVRSAGAYGSCMSSNYNSRPRVAEVLVDGERFGLVRDRESFEDLVRNEHLTPQWIQGG